MGNSASFDGQYDVPVPGSQSKDTTAIFRAITHPSGTVDDFVEVPCVTGRGIFKRGLAMNNGANACLGYRKRDSNGTLEDCYSWMTYGDVDLAARTLGTKLLRDGHMEPIEYPEEEFVQAKSLRLLGLFSKNNPEWFVCEQAANAYGFTLVPLYDTLGAQALEFILRTTRMRVVACSIENVSSLIVGVEATRHLKTVIVFNEPHRTVDTESIAKLEQLNVKVVFYADLVKSNGNSTLPVVECASNDVNTLCYTSGTTGNPKGVILTHLNVVSCVAATVRGPIEGNFQITEADCHVSYLPLAHVFERLVSNIVLAMGARIGIFSGDITKLLDDVKIMQPTVFISVPRLFNRINDVVFRGVSQKSTVARFLFERGMNSKLNQLRSNATATHKLWDAVVFNKTKNLMGNKLRYMISGGAPIDAVIQERIQVLFCAPLMQGYGMTETCGPTFLAHCNDPVYGHIGGVFPCNEFCLRSVPEMSYFVSDKPCPRGELLLRGHSIFVGYFLDPAETHETLDSDGWLHTGDIAVLLPGGAIKIIDRKKNIFKLAQGEYVAPEKIEAVYVQCPLVSQVFVFGYSTKNSLVAIVIPDMDAVKLWVGKSSAAKSKNIDLNDICCGEPFKAAVMQQFNKTGDSVGLKGFEKVKDVFVDTQPFSIENGLLTPTMKIKRHPAEQMYKSQIDDMYRRLGE